MIIDKNKFLESVRYIIEINKQDLDDIDMSELTNDDLEEVKRQWKFTGLNNKDFIMTYMDELIC